jgi:hypothetical protein
MSDYNPNDPRRPDGNVTFTPPSASSGRGLYWALGIVAALVVVVGLVFFTSRPNDRTDVAREPDRTIDVPATTNEPRTPTVPPRPMSPPTTQEAPKPQE